MFSAQAQNKADSLRLIIKEGKQNTATARAWSELAFIISWNNPDSMLLCGQRSLDIAEKINSDTARFHALEAIASSYYATNQYSKGIEAGRKAYLLAQKYKNPYWESTISNILGFLYNNAQKYKEAIPFFDNSVNFNRKLGQKQNLASALNNLANTYMLMKEIKQSLVYRLEAMALRKELNLPSALGDCYNDLGETYMMLGKTDSAIKYFNECFVIKQKVNDVEMLALSGLNMGNALHEKGKHKEALTYLQTAERCAKEIGSNQYLFGIYLQMSKCFKALGKKDEAYQYLEKHIAYKDSVINLASQKQLNELTEQFQSEKRTLEIESLKKEKEKDILLANERDKRKNTVLALVALILLAIGIYTYLLYKRFKLTQEQKKIIEEQKQLVEEKQREILDSIHYARRIQRSLMPNEKYITSRLTRLTKK